MGIIVIISGSTSVKSRSSALAQVVGNLLGKGGNQVEHICVRDIPPEDLVYAKFDSPAIQEAATLISDADALVVISPVYKASYTGIIKAFFDLLPEKALAGKTILPIANGGTSAHLLALEYAFKPLFSILGARDILDGIFIVDSQIQYSKTEVRFQSEEIEQRFHWNINKLISALPQFNESIK
jgi:FMN reductase